jgi:hypothetical protein
MALLIGPVFFVYVLALILTAGLGGIFLVIWALIDVSSHSRAAFYGAGYNRSAWIVVLAGSIFLGLAFFPSVAYLAFSRPKVVSVERALGEVC